jgi:acyl-CoA hydrolase
MNDPEVPIRDVTLRFLAAPTEINAYGKIHGGAVMKWIDEAGYTCAAGWSGRYSVTVYVSGIRFYKPIFAGDLVEVHARLIHTGTTSMHIAIDVQAGDPRSRNISKTTHCAGDPRSRNMSKTTHCIIVFVALDDEGHPAPVPKWEPRTEEDRALQNHALRLMELNKVIETEMQPYLKNP